MPQVEQAIVVDAVTAAGELHEAGDGAVVDDHRIAGNGAVGQRADAAVIGQGRGAPGRAQDNAGGRQTESVEPTPVTSACHPPITDAPCATLTVVPPPPAALMPALNSPVVDTFVVVTCTVPVVEVAQIPCRFDALRCDRPLTRRRDHDGPARSASRRRDHGGLPSGRSVKCRAANDRAAVGENAVCAEAVCRDWAG